MTIHTYSMTADNIFVFESGGTADGSKPDRRSASFHAVFDLLCAHTCVCMCTHHTCSWHNHLCFLACIRCVWLDLCVGRYLSNLKRLTLAHNKIKGKWTFFPISCLSNLTELRLTGNELPEPPTGVARYHCLHVSGFACVCLHVCVCMWLSFTRERSFLSRVCSFWWLHAQGLRVCGLCVLCVSGCQSSSSSTGVLWTKRLILMWNEEKIFFCVFMHVSGCFFRLSLSIRIVLACLCKHLIALHSLVHILRSSRPFFSIMLLHFSTNLNTHHS
jgi:hypothetical protein